MTLSIWCGIFLPVSIFLLQCVGSFGYDGKIVKNLASIQSTPLPCSLESAEISTYANHYEIGSTLAPRSVLNGVGLRPTPWNRYFVNSYTFRVTLDSGEDNIDFTGQYMFKFFSSPSGVPGPFGRCFHGANLGNLSDIANNWPDIGEILFGLRDLEDSSKIILSESFSLKKALLDGSEWQGASASFRDREATAGIRMTAGFFPRDVFIILRLFGCTSEFPAGTMDLSIQSAIYNPLDGTSIVGWTTMAESPSPSSFAEIDISNDLNPSNIPPLSNLLTISFVPDQAPVPIGFQLNLPIPRDAPTNFIKAGDFFSLDLNTMAAYLNDFTTSFASSLFRPVKLDSGKAQTFTCNSQAKNGNSIQFSAVLSDSFRLTALTSEFHEETKWLGDTSVNTSLVPFYELKTICSLWNTLVPTGEADARANYFLISQLDSPKSLICMQASLETVVYDPFTLEAVESVVERSWHFQAQRDERVITRPVTITKPTLLEFSSVTPDGAQAPLIRVRTKFPLNKFLPTIHSSEPLAFALSLPRAMFNDILDEQFSLVTLSEAFITKFTVIPEKNFGAEWFNTRDILRFNAKLKNTSLARGIPAEHCYSRATTLSTTAGPVPILELLMGFGSNSNWMIELRESLESKGLPLPTHLAAFQQVVSIEVEFFLHAPPEAFTGLQQYFSTSSQFEDAAWDNAISIGQVADHFSRSWVSALIPRSNTLTQSVRHDDGILLDFSVKPYPPDTPISGLHLASDLDRSVTSVITSSSMYYMRWDFTPDLEPTPQLPVNSQFIIDYGYENIITNFAIVLPTFPLFEDALPGDSNDGVDVFFNAGAINAVQGGSSTNGLNINPHSIQCLTIPSDSYSSSASVLYNWRMASVSGLKIATAYRRAKPNSTTVSNVQAYKNAFDVVYPDSTTPEGHGLAVDEELDLNIFHISLGSHANISQSGLVIICSNADVKGPLLAHSNTDNSYSVPMFFARSLDSSVFGHGKLQTSVILPGLPGSEVERDANGALRMKVSLHRGLDNTRKYNAVSINEEDSNPDNPTQGVLLQHLTSLPMLTPFALRIDIPTIGIDNFFVPNQLSDLTKIAIKSRLLKPIGSAMPYVEVSRHLYGGGITTYTKLEVDIETSSEFISFTIPIYFGEFIRFSPRDSFSIVIHDLMFRRDELIGSSEPTLILESVKLIFSGDFHVNRFETKISTIPQAVSLPLLSLAPFSTHVDIRRLPSTTPRIRGGIVPLIYSAALPAVFTKEFPDPSRCGGRILLQLPLPTGAIYPVPKISLYKEVVSNESLGTISPVTCEIQRLEAKEDGTSNISVLTSFKFEDELLHSTEHDVRVLLPNMLDLAISDGKMSHAILCTVYTYLTKDYDPAKGIPQMSFMGKNSCEDGATSTEYTPLLILGQEQIDEPFFLPPIDLPVLQSTISVSPALISIPTRLTLTLDHFPGFILPHDTFELEFPTSHQPTSTPAGQSLPCHLSRAAIQPYSTDNATTTHPILGLRAESSLPMTSMFAEGRISTSLTNTAKKILVVTVLPPTSTGDISGIHLATLSSVSFGSADTVPAVPPLLLTCDNVVYSSPTPAHDPFVDPPSSFFSLRSRNASVPPNELDILREPGQSLFELSTEMSFPAILKNQFEKPLLQFSRTWAEEPVIPGSPTLAELGNITFTFEKLTLLSYLRPSATSPTLVFRLNMPAGFRTLSYSSPLTSSSLCEGTFTVSSPSSPSGFSLQTFPLRLTLSSANPSAPVATHSLLLEVPSSAREALIFWDPTNPSLGVFLSSTSITCKGFAPPLFGPISEHFVLSAHAPSYPIGITLAQSEIFMNSSPSHAVTMGTRAAASATASFLPPVVGALATLTYVLSPARVKGRKFEMLLELPAGTNCESNGDVNQDILEIPVVVTTTLLVASSGAEILLNTQSLDILSLDLVTFAFGRGDDGDTGAGPFVVPSLGIVVPFEIPRMVHDSPFTMSSADGIRVRIAKVRTPPVASATKERAIRAQITEVSSPVPASMNISSSTIASAFEMRSESMLATKSAFEDSSSDSTPSISTSIGQAIPSLMEVVSPTFFAARKIFLLSGLEDGQGRMALQRVVVDPYRGRFAAFASPSDAGREGFPTTGGLFVFSLPAVIPFVNPEMVSCTIAHHDGDSYLTEPSANAFPVTSVSIDIFSPEGDGENEGDEAWSTQGNRSRVTATISPQTAQDLALTPYQFGIVVQCISATPIALELRSEATYYIQIYKLKSVQAEEPPSYISISSTITATLSSTRAPSLTSNPIFSQSSHFAGDMGSIQLFLEHLTLDIRRNDVVELAFPYTAYYRFGDTVVCTMTRVTRRLIDEVEEEIEEEIETGVVRTSFSSTSLFRATTAAQSENQDDEDGDDQGTQPHIVSFRFSSQRKSANPNDDEENTTPIFKKGDGFKWSCINVTFPSNARNTQSYLKVSVYHSLTEFVSFYVDPVDTLLVRTAFNDDVSLPYMAPQRPRSVTFHSASPYLGAHTRIGVEIVLTDSIALNSQERQIVLALEMPPKWALSLSTSCTMSVGSPYLEDANMTGEVVITIPENDQENGILTFSFFPPDGVLRHINPLYLFCTDIKMPLSVSVDGKGNGDVDNVNMVNEIDEIVSHFVSDADNSRVLKYQTLPSSSILASDENLANILAQATSAHSPILTSEYPEMTSIISISHSFVSHRPFLESEIEDWKSTLAQVYGLRIYSTYSEITDITSASTLASSSLLASAPGVPLGVGSNRVVGIRALSQRRIPLIASPSTGDKQSIPLTVFGSRNYVPDFHYEVKLTAEIRSPQPWLTIEKIYETMSAPRTVVNANATFSQRYNLSPFTSTLSLDVISSSCMNGVIGEDETDIDCGGSTCVKCHVGNGCASASDCLSGVCGNAGVCLDVYSAAQGTLSSLSFWLIFLFAFVFVM